MNSVHLMWLFVASLLLFIGISFCADCHHEAKFSAITVSSSLNSTYGKKNINSASDEPWVGGSNSSNWFSLDFLHPIYLKSIHMTGGKLDLFQNNTLVECHIVIFLVQYKLGKTGQWKRHRKYKDVTGDYKADLNIKEPVRSINVTIKKYFKCPAVKMIKLIACGNCTEPTVVNGQIPSCAKTPPQQVQECTITCRVGFVTKNSPNSVLKTCLPNGTWSGPDLACEDKDECKNMSICGNNETCQNGIGSYKCSCRNGYDGYPNCEDINECNSVNPCQNNFAYCTNTPGSYSCQCKGGYSGDGSSCTDIDECARSSCDVGGRATCINTIGSYLCSCTPGYSGDGVTCSDIDECARWPCDVEGRATCKNTQGSFICSCTSGYSGDGITCSDVNECEKNEENTKCPKYANCTNTIGSFKCNCLEGFSGGDCKGDPVNITSIFSNKEIRFGKALNEKCEAKGLPIPRIEWSTPNKNISGSILYISSLTLRDDGVYRCIASNNDTGATKTFTVMVIGKPTEVPKPTTDETSATTVRISWREPSDEGASSIKGYKICYRGAGDEKCVTARSLSIVISDLIPNTEYEIWVLAMNEQGNSEKENEITVFTLGPKPEELSPPSMEDPLISSSTVKIQVKKVNTDQNAVLRVQVIVQKLSQRRKRNTDDPSGLIPGYDEADCKENSECLYITAELENNETNFVVGDGEMYGEYRNVELEPDTAYKIYVRGVSYNKREKENFGDVSEPLDVTTTALATKSPKSNGSVVGIAVGLTVLFVVLIVLVLLAVIYFRSRRPKTVEIDPETGEKKGRKKNINSELLPLTKKGHGKRKSGQVEDGLPDPNHPPVPTAGFAKYVGKLHKSDDRGFMIQYNTLETSQTYTSEIATIPENKEKNRYANIVAYDVSRVHLKQIDDDDNSSYINASLVDGYNSANAYIATQGPLPDTFNDFWRMVWEKNCSSVVMLTNLQERHKLKCHKYWPEESETYGQITVTATRKEQYADYVIRTFLLKMNETEEEREIKQFHFTVWPDHGVPEYPTAILAFQRRVRAYSTRDSGPLAVHCSAGVGRSGTFIVIDCMLARIQSEQTIDIYNYVRYLRTRRMFMVQTEEQYVFCHDALLESILCGNTQMAAHNLRIEMNRLRQKDATTKMTGFESEFKILDKVSPSLPKESFVVASYPQNASKNRYNDILASDHGRVMLGDDDDSDEGPYVNAVYVDGYKQQNAFILTQAPLKETIKDLWQMLYEKRSACVLLLTDLTAEEGDFPQFWPGEGSEEYDKYLVELVSDVSTGDTGSEDQFQQEKLSEEIVERKFRLTKAEDKPLVVKMFHHLSWPETSVPTDISAIISLIQRIEKWQQRSGNGPITVICNDGQGRSGTFAALCSVLERVKTEQVVDVFQTIKALRIQRPGIVKHVDQYQFIHFGVQEYLDSFSDYANFK